MSASAARLTACLALLAGCLAMPVPGSATPAPGLFRPVPDAAGVWARDVPLSEDRLDRPLRTEGVDLIGITWRGGPGAAGEIVVRSRSEGEWTDSQQATVLDHGPDRGSPEDQGVTGTDLLWVSDADQVEIGVSGRLPEGLTLALIDVRSDDVRAPRTARKPSDNPLRPRVLGRDAWGADPRLRDGRPAYNRTIQQLHVHHTVNSNDYTAAEVPALIRGMYRYHTVNLGWSDIGYNFLVDRFGRTWTGRAGGIKRAVQGAHTLGFNSTSTGVALIGNFEIARPTRKARTALVHLAAWKLAAYHRDPREAVTVFSRGSDRFRAGTRVRLPVLDGHRDTNQTACPGERLYERLPEIRLRAAMRIERFR